MRLCSIGESAASRNDHNFPKIWNGLSFGRVFTGSRPTPAMDRTSASGCGANLGFWHCSEVKRAAAIVRFRPKWSVAASAGTLCWRVLNRPSRSQTLRRQPPQLRQPLLWGRWRAWAPRPAACRRAPSEPRACSLGRARGSRQTATVWPVRFAQLSQSSRPAVRGSRQPSLRGRSEWY